MNFSELKKRVFLPVKQNYERKLHNLNYLFFELTHRCNLECIHCGSDCVRNDTVPDLPKEKIIEVLKEIKSHQNSKKVMIVLSGGEPTIYPDVWKLGREIYDLEFPWGMVTNGFAWTKHTIADAKKARMHSVTVSLDGLEENHNWLRGHPESFRRAKKAIEMLIEDPFWKAMDVITCVNKKNIHELDDIREMLMSMGVKKWRFFTISPIGRAVENNDLFLDEAQFKGLMKKILHYKKIGGIKVNYSESGYLGCYEHKVRSHDFFCRAGINVSGVMVNGDILACPNNSRDFRQGNVFEDSFIDVWENKYQVFRNRNWMKKGECKDCSEWRMCKGGAFHLWEPDSDSIKLCPYKEFNLKEEK